MKHLVSAMALSMAAPAFAAPPALTPTYLTGDWDDPKNGDCKVGYFVMRIRGTKIYDESAEEILPYRLKAGRLHYADIDGNPVSMAAVPLTADTMRITIPNMSPSVVRRCD